MVQTVSDGAVLLHMDTEVYFGLNSVGAHVWKLLPPECREFDELCSRLGEVYPDAEADTLRRDVEILIDQFQENDLVIDPDAT